MRGPECIPSCITLHLALSAVHQLEFVTGSMTVSWQHSTVSAALMHVWPARLFSPLAVCGGVTVYGALCVEV